jgi:hypothetical protein
MRREPLRPPAVTRASGLSPDPGAAARLVGDRRWPPRRLLASSAAHPSGGARIRRSWWKTPWPISAPKLPLVIHIDPLQLVALNKTCRYCPPCDLLIAHRDELEAWLAAFFGQHEPEIVGNDYLVVGTEDRPDWRRGVHTPLSTGEALECLHDFIEVVRFEPAPRWGPA